MFDRRDCRYSNLVFRRTNKLPWIDLGEVSDMYGATAVAYGVRALPTTYLIDSNQQIVRKNITPSDVKTVLLDRLEKSSSDD